MKLKNWLTQFKHRKKLKDRFYLKEVPRKGVWFYYGKWSVMNVGKLMKLAPFKWSGFDGWEAMRHHKKGMTIHRNNSLEELLKIIKN
jgi:hypothetical protein